MKNRELLDFKNSNYLSHGFPAILEKVQPIMDEFIDEMISLDELDLFVLQEKVKVCVLKLNDVGFVGWESIETVEREIIGKAFDDIGRIIGFPNIWDEVEKHRDF